MLKKLRRLFGFKTADELRREQEYISELFCKCNDPEFRQQVRDGFRAAEEKAGKEKAPSPSW